MSKHSTVAATIWFPNQRVLRTIVQAVIAAVPTVVAIIGILADQWPAQWLVVTSAAAVAIQGVLARIMALPGVDAWLTGIGLGAAPKAAVQNADGSYVVTSIPSAVKDQVLAQHAQLDPDEKNASEQTALSRTTGDAPAAPSSGL